MVLLKSIPKVDKFIASEKFKSMAPSLVLAISKRVLQELKRVNFK